MAGRFSIEAIFKGKDYLSRVIGKIHTQFDRFERAATGNLRNVDKAFMKVHGGIKKTALVVAGAAGAAGAGIMNIVQSGAEFEQAISSVGAVSLMTRDQIADLEAKARELGASTQFTATQVAGAMELMGRAGFTNAEILSGIPGILAAAAAEGEDIATVAGTVSDALKGMGMATSESGRVADVLALASAKTNSSITSLGESLSQVASKARQMKLPFEQVVASVALLQDVGLDASTAGTALKAMLTKLAKPTKIVVKDMQRLGLSTKSFKNAKGDMLPMEEVLRKLVTATKKAGGNFDQSAFLARMFGLETETAAMNMLKLFEEGKIQDLTKGLDAAGGSAQKMADIRMNNLLGDWEKFTGAIDGVKLSLFDLQAGPLRDLVKGMTAWVEQNQKLIVSEVADFLKELKDNLPSIVTWVKRIGVAVGIFYAMAMAVKAAQLALATYRGIVITATIAKAAYLLVTKQTTKSEVGFGAALKGNATAAQLAAAANAELALAMEGLSGATAATGGKFAALRGALNSSALGSAINGVTSTMGKAGLLGAALAVGYAIGTWIDEATGFSDWAAQAMNKMFGGEDALEAAGGRATHRGFQPGDEGVRADGSTFTPQVVTPEERIAREVTEAKSSSTEKVEVEIKAPPGQAEVKRGKRPAKGASIKLKPSGAF